MEWQAVGFACCDRCGTKLVCPKCKEEVSERAWSSAEKPEERAQAIMGKASEFGYRRPAGQEPDISQSTIVTRKKVTSRSEGKSSSSR